MKIRIRPRAVITSVWYKGFHRRIRRVYIDTLVKLNYFKGEE